MTAYEKMMLRNEAIGSTIRQQMINNTREEVEALLEDDPSYKTAEIIRSGKVVGDIGVRMNNRKLVNEVPQMDIIAPLSNKMKFKRGDILKVLTVEDDETKEDYWLCFEENNFHGIQRDGKIELCNFLMPLQDEDNLSIFYEWCVVSRYKTSSTGEDAGKVVTVDNTRRNVLIQFNERTAKLYQGKRFFIDLEGLNNPKPYELTDLDRTSYIYNGVGCFQLVCKEVQILPEDRPDLMICDYIETPLPSPIPIGFCDITYSGEPILKIGGPQKRFAVVFKDNDGNPISTIIPVWEIIPSEFANENQRVILSQDGNEIILETKSNVMAGKSFVLKVSGDDNEFGYFETRLEIHVKDLF